MKQPQHTGNTIRARSVLWGLGCALLPAAALAMDANELSQQLKAPAGFEISVFALVDNPRQLAYSDGVVYAGSMRAGNVYGIAVDDRFNAQAVRILAKDLDWPVGVAVKEGSLYISAMSRILKLPAAKAAVLNRAPSSTAASLQVVSARFPKDRAHGWKFIAFGPDGWLYVPVGAPCNICEPNPDVYATVGKLNVDTGMWTVVARGIRNSVGFDWNPVTRSLWISSNNRDWLGDDSPPDMLVKAPATDKPDTPLPHFGYPYCHAGTVSDPEFGSKKRCDEFAAVAQTLGAHVAPLGIRFYNGTQFPRAYKGSLLVAEHGSWNRTQKSGYQISQVTVNNKDDAIRYQPFITGWLRGQTVLGRPADVLVLPDGSLLVSDDTANAIFRIRYGASNL